MENVAYLNVKNSLRCSACGATTEAACDCGAGYVPATEVARRAVIKDPHRSVREVAAEVGVSKSTVSRARNPAKSEGSEVSRGGTPRKRRPDPYDVAMETMGAFPGLEQQIIRLWKMLPKRRRKILLKHLQEDDFS
jgi:hypothetical protein